MGWKESKSKIHKKLTFNKVCFPALRSMWVGRLVNYLIVGGKKAKAEKLVSTALGELKTFFSRSPSIILFESLEEIRFPIKITERKRGRRILLWLDLLPWWKQYSQLLRSFRECAGGKQIVSGRGRLASEVISIVENVPSSKLMTRRAVLSELASEARLQSHYRWRR